MFTLNCVTSKVMKNSFRLMKMQPKKSSRFSQLLGFGVIMASLVIAMILAQTGIQSYTTRSANLIINPTDILNSPTPTSQPQASPTSTPSSQPQASPIPTLTPQPQASLTPTQSKTPTTTASGTRVIRVPQDYPAIEVAYDAANHGDQIVVAPGTYSVCLSGNRTKMITLKAQYPAITSVASQQTILNSDCSHVIQFRTPLDDDGIFQPGDHVEFIGFVLNGSNDGFSFEGASGIVTDNIISGQSDDPVDIDGASEAYIIGNILRDGKGKGDGIENRLHRLSSDRVIKLIFRDNVIYNSRSDGIQLIGQTGSLTKREYLISNNLIVNNNLAGLGTTGGGDSDQTNFPGGFPLPEKIYVLQNTFVNNGMGGILGGANMVVHNNIFYNNSNVDLKNVSGSSIASHNLFFGSAIDYQGSNVQSPNVFADPEFINTTFPLNFSSYLLGSGSPAIDAGKDVSSYYTLFGVNPPAVVGNAPDIGWMEYSAGP